MDSDRLSALSSVSVEERNLPAAERTPFVIPVTMATEDSLAGLATLVTDYNNTPVEKTPWPLSGTRKAKSGTDMIPGETCSEITYKYCHGQCLAKKTCGRENVIGLTVKPPQTTNKTSDQTSKQNQNRVLVSEMTYHPDCGEIFFPENGDAFVALLAPPGDDFLPSKVRAFYFDGSVGLQVHPFVWHAGVYPVSDDAVFQGKQGVLHCCITVNTVQEFGRFMAVDLAAA